MPELPDIVLLAESMNHALVDKTISGSQVNQAKVLNYSKRIIANTKYSLTIPH